MTEIVTAGSFPDWVKAKKPTESWQKFLVVSVHRDSIFAILLENL